jgi:hypothetical protein
MNPLGLLWKPVVVVEKSGFVIANGPELSVFCRPCQSQKAAATASLARFSGTFTADTIVQRDSLGINPRARQSIVDNAVQRSGLTARKR